jgi:hypothetical protein
MDHGVRARYGRELHLICEIYRSSDETLHEMKKM